MHEKYKGIHPETGEWVEETPASWGWEVTYHDGSKLKQYADDGSFHWVREIEADKVKTIALTSFYYPQVYTLSIPDNCQFMIYSKEYIQQETFLRLTTEEDKKQGIGGKILGFLKNQFNQELTQEFVREHRTWGYIIGYQYNKTKKIRQAVKTCIVAFPSGNVIVTNNPDNIVPKIKP